MPSIIRAHYDGRVIVPDEPVDLLRGQSIERCGARRNPAVVRRTLL